MTSRYVLRFRMSAGRRTRRPGRYRPEIDWSWPHYDRFNSPLLKMTKGRRNVLKRQK